MKNASQNFRYGVIVVRYPSIFPNARFHVYTQWNYRD